MLYLESKWRCCVNNESNSLKRLIIGGWVNYIRDHDNVELIAVELIAEFLDVSLEFLSIPVTKSRNSDQ
jgi:hypothetical protein